MALRSPIRRLLHVHKSLDAPKSRSLHKGSFPGRRPASHRPLDASGNPATPLPGLSRRIPTRDHSDMNREAFYQLIDKAVEAPPGTIRGDENLADVIGWDSMAQVTFMTEFDKHFGRRPHGGGPRPAFRKRSRQLNGAESCRLPHQFPRKNRVCLRSDPSICQSLRNFAVSSKATGDRSRFGKRGSAIGGRTIPR
jgi:hypothetical protein